MNEWMTDPLLRNRIIRCNIQIVSEQMKKSSKDGRIFESSSLANCHFIIKILLLLLQRNGIIIIVLFVLQLSFCCLRCCVYCRNTERVNRSNIFRKQNKCFGDLRLGTLLLKFVLFWVVKLYEWPFWSPAVVNIRFTCKNLLKNLMLVSEINIREKKF